MRKILILVAAIGLTATACSGDDPFNASPGTDDTTTTRDDGEVIVEIDGDEIVLTSSLSGFDSCDALLDHLRTEGAERVGPYGFDGGGWYGGPVPLGPDVVFEAADEDFARAGDDDAASDTPTSGNAAQAELVEGVDFSGTNVQERGVDEADIIKTDGERILVVSDNELVVVDVERREVVGSVDVVAGQNAELFISGDEILHVTQTWVDGDTFPTPRPATGGDAEAEFADAELALDIAFYGTTHTVITRISADGGAPRVLESLSVDGDYVSSRAVDGVARIVLRSNPQYRFPFVYPQGPAGEERAEESNRDALLESELADWLPGYAIVDANGSVSDDGLLPRCEQVHAPTEFAGFGVLSVLTVPVDGDLDPAATSSVLAPGDVVYSSTESLYVATSNWIDPVVIEDESDWQRAWENRQTSLHRFDISSNSSAAYTASGSVAGDIRNSFSLSEHDGHLRVVTTTGETWDESSESFVRVLRESSGALMEVGSVGDLGNGEAVQSVRFDGDIGYVVTFRQIDPFYTVDLSDPENPRVVGELKIPGFSSYLHPIGDGLVLGVGSAGDGEGRINGSKVSLFDVSDLSQPREVAVWTAPDGWNDVGWDHRSFLWWDAEGLAVVPVDVWSQSWSGAVVLKVDGDSITEVGRIDHADEGAQAGRTDCDVLSGDDLPGADPDRPDSELEAMLFEEWGSVLRCDDQDDGGMTGFECYEEPWLAEEAAVAGLDLEDDQRVEVCWPIEDNAQGINRTMVLPDDELWSMSTNHGDLSGQSDARLQVNDLRSLERLDTVQL